MYMKEIAKLDKIVSSQIVTRKEHWYSRKKRVMVVFTETGIYEMEAK